MTPIINLLIPVIFSYLLGYLCRTAEPAIIQLFHKSAKKKPKKTRQNLSSSRSKKTASKTLILSSTKRSIHLVYFRTRASACSGFLVIVFVVLCWIQRSRTVVALWSVRWEPVPCAVVRVFVTLFLPCMDLDRNLSWFHRKVRHSNLNKLIFCP